MVVGLLQPTSGEVRIDGVSMTDIKAVAGAPATAAAAIQMIFQDPYASLNPRLRVDADRCRANPRLRSDRRASAIFRPGSAKLLNLVGLHPERRHEVSARIFRPGSGSASRSPGRCVRGEFIGLRRADRLRA